MKEDLVVVSVAAVAAVAAMSAALMVLPDELVPWRTGGPRQQGGSVIDASVYGDPVLRRSPPRAVELKVSRTLVPIVDIPDDLTPLEIATRRKPRVLRNWSHVASLGASQWTFDTLRSTFSEGDWALRHVRGQYKSPVFRLEHAKEGAGSALQDLGTWEESDLNTFNGIPFHVFVDTAATPNVPYLYYTAPLDDWRVVGLESDMQGVDKFAVLDPVVVSLTTDAKGQGQEGGDGTDAQQDVPISEDDLQAAAEASVATLWMSHPNVTAHAHYDQSHNFLIQLIGRKRVLLYPPRQYAYLYPFPHTHVSYHQSQVDFADPDVLTFPDFTRAGAVEAILEPGDAIYIPPFWWHRIEALDLSLSMSVVSPSAEEGHLAKASWTKLPFGALESVEQKAVGVQIYLVHLLSRLRGITSPRDYARELYDLRFAALFPESSLEALRVKAAPTEEEDMCLMHRPDKHKFTRDKLPKERIIASARTVAELVNYDEFVETKILQVWLGDYLEDLARWAVGTSRVHLFVAQCLDFDRLPDEAISTIWEEGPAVLSFEDDMVES
eukprot:CAMPEP_0118970540 /NCGR_PEP_ID=MMETSP1173-20130426/7412_1 /TAXON_ID=1034831 /ORGANISM="Rhizochromulina marina cf, Strain CCMP1243" /LENGTH=551 /DNA_ID=CAMNT_0006919915 /DNA_START=42 /DNA_END=1697 /DNA_ORIENTATION=-